MSESLDRAVDELLAQWEGPCGGTPPFDRATPEAIRAAYEIAADLRREEIRTIASSPEPPDFENTVADLEDAGRELRRLGCLLDVFSRTANLGVMREVERRLTPLAARLEDEIIQNPALWDRVHRVWKNRHAAILSAEEKRLTEVVHDRFRRRGAGLETEAGKRLAEINERIAELSARFSQNVLADEDDGYVVLEDENDLDGLGGDLRDALAETAKKLGRDGGWAVANRRTLVVPFLTFSARRDLRERVWRMWAARGGHPGERDNRPVAAEILRLRGEKVSLLGFESYAHFATADFMCGAPEAALELVRRVWHAVIGRAETRLAELGAMAEREGLASGLQPWDRRFFAEKWRRQNFDLDSDSVRAHLSLESMLGAAFWTASELHGLEFEERAGVPVVHDSIRVFEVLREGEPGGMLWLDLYARPGKVSGGWMGVYRTAESFRGKVPPLVSINLNLTEPRAGEVTHLSWEEARVLFHEFGHALHALCCEASFPSLGILALNPDVLEVPSILHERWLPTPEVLERFAVDDRTGEALPRDLADTIETMRRSDPPEGETTTLEYLATAVLDLELHLAADGRDLDPFELEQRVFAEFGLPDAAEPLHRTAHLRHAFAGLFEDRYAAGYYGYLWAEMLAADIAEAFEDSPDGFWDREMAALYRRSILAVGSGVPPDQAFRNLRGRVPDSGALTRRLAASRDVGKGRRS